jgi:hypothetical protein
MCICRTQSQALFCSPCSKLTPSLPPCPMQEMQQLRQGAAAIGRTRSASNAEEGQGEAAAEAEALEEGGVGDEEARPCPRFCKVTASASAGVALFSAAVVGERALSQVPISEVRRVAFELTVVDLEDSGELFIGAVQVWLATLLLVNSSTFVHFINSLGAPGAMGPSCARGPSPSARRRRARARARAERWAARGAVGVREGRTAQGRAAHQRGLRQEAARARRRLPPGEPRQQPQPQLRGQFLRRRASPPPPVQSGHVSSIPPY